MKRLLNIHLPMVVLQWLSEQIRSVRWTTVRGGHWDTNDEEFRKQGHEREVEIRAVQCVWKDLERNNVER